MRTQVRGLAAALILSLGLAGCAASAGSVAGNVIGGAAWGAMKGGKLAWKGGSLAAKTAGRTVVGAAKGVHEEFSGPKPSSSDGSVQTASAEQTQPARTSADGEAAALAN